MVEVLTSISVSSFQRGENSQRSQLMSGNQSLSRASESIARSHRIAAETDAIGADIVDELGSQREQLVNTRDRVRVLLFKVI